MNGDAGARVLARPPRLPDERHRPHAQPGHPDPRRDAPAAGEDAERAGRVQAARAARPPRAARRHRHEGPLPARPARVLAQPRPDPEHHDPVRGRRLPRPRRAARPASSPTSATTASSKRPLVTWRRRRHTRSVPSGRCRSVREPASSDRSDRARRARRRSRARSAGASTARCCPNARPATHGSPTPLHPEVAARLEARGIDAAVRAPGRGDRRAARAAAASSSRPEPRRGSRSATRCRSSRRSSRTGATPRSCSSRPRRSRRTSCARCARGSFPACAPSPTTATPTADDRAWARKNANVVLTNPEMLHMGILPSHKRWATFLMRLQLRRRRRAAHVARHLRIARRARAAPPAPRCASTTARSPTFCLRERDDRQPGRARERAVRARRSSRSTTTRRRAPNACSRAGNARCSTRTPARAASANVETAELMTRFVRAEPPDARVHAQPARRRGRRAVRAPAARRRSRPSSPTGSPRTAPATSPRSGARSSSSSSSGRLLGIAATNALELGIDIGGLDAVVLNGFPGTLASMWQQAGRAGRTGRRSAAVLVAGDDQLDQWYAAHPDRADPARARARGRQSAEPVHRARRRSRARRTSCR